MRIVRYLFTIVRFATRVSPWVFIVLFLAVFGTILEFIALSDLVPLTQAINHSHMSIISQYWNRLLEGLGVNPDVKTWFSLFLALMLLRIVMQFGFSVLASRVARDVTTNLSAGSFRRFMTETSLLEIQRHKIGHFIAVAGDEAMRAGQIFLYFSQMLITGLSVLVTIAAMIVFSFKLAAGVAMFVLITGIAILQSTRRVYLLGSVIKNESRIATSTFLDGLNGLRSVRSIGGEQYVVHQYTDQIIKYNHTLFRVDFTTHAQKSLPVVILLSIVLALIVYLSPDRIMQFDIASLLAAMILLIRFFPSAGAFLNNGMKLLADLRAAHDVVSVATAPLAQGASGRPCGAPVREIELSDVHYRYEGSAAEVLDGISFRFKAGSSYAICGPSGSGKSTLVDLILALIPNAGIDIRVNGAPLSELDARDYRKKVILVEQQSRIFNDTVRNNIVFGLTASEEEIRTAVRLAAFDQVLSALPNGLETMLDYQGTNLSGGQRQRLGIARALLRNPDVLVLDESVSALDAPTRNAVLSNILAHFRDRIVIVVTHDSVVISQMQHTLMLRAPPQASGSASGSDRPRSRRPRIRVRLVPHRRHHGRVSSRWTPVSGESSSGNCPPSALPAWPAPRTRRRRAARRFPAPSGLSRRRSAAHRSHR
jgi:ABC-type bacteriocin/lantibiotic exporter with double-glycine peptidase domain